MLAYRQSVGKRMHITNQLGEMHPINRLADFHSRENVIMAGMKVLETEPSLYARKEDVRQQFDAASTVFWENG